MKLGSIWAMSLYGLVAGALAMGCGTGEGKRSVRPCPDDCPAAECDADTGKCSAPPAEATGGQGNEPEPPSGGMPNEPEPSDDVAPTVTVTSPAQGAVLGPTVTFDFEADEPSTYVCMLNDEPVDDCEPGITLVDLQSGDNTFSVVATDDAGNESEPVEVTFFVNRSPEIGELAALETPEDTSTGAIPFTIGDVDTDLADLMVTASLDSELPIPEAGVLLAGDGAERTVVLNPALNAFGPAVLTLAVSDGFVTTTRDVQVLVTPVNDPPTIEDVPDKRVAEHAVMGPVAFRVGDVETAGGDLVVTASSSDQTKVPNGNIALGGAGEQRTITITPVAQQSGPVTITLKVSDGELTATDTFVLTLGSTDDEPTLSAISDQTTPEDTPKTVAFTVADPDTAVATLTPSASFAANGIVQSVTFGGSGANRSFKVTPKPNQTGTAVVTITISDASGGVSDSFTLTVTPVNDAPTVSPPSNETIDEDGTTGALAFSVADVDSPALSLSASSSNTTLIPNANIVVSPLSAAPGGRTVTVTPLANRSGGPVTITLTVSDGSLSGSGTFTVTVRPVNDAPTISNISDRTVEPDTSTGAVGFTVADADGDTPLAVTASSSDQRVVPAANISLAGSGANRNITVVPGTNQGGAATITVTVNDGNGGTASDTFVLSAKVKLTGAKVGNGTVVASGSGCPGGTALCTALPGAGAVTFVATPEPGAVFVNWTGACSGTGNGTVTPIPNAGVTCTANFRNLWARLFHAPLDVAQQVLTSAHGVVETPKGLHYLGGIPGRSGTTASVWNANLATGAVIANTAFSLHQDGTSLSPLALVRDGSDGTVALVNAVARSGSGLIWFDETNQLVRARSYEAGGSIQQTPYAVVRANAGGLTFTETSHDASPVAVFPTFGQLVRVGASGEVIGGTRYLEGLGNCEGRTTTRNVVPYSLAQNGDGSYLVVGSVPALLTDPATGPKLNLTLFSATGVPLWGRHIEPTPVDRIIIPISVVANGDDFLVTGAISDAKESYDGFGLLIGKAGDVKWWKSFGADGVVDAAFRGIARGANFVVTGYGPSPDQNGHDLFAATWTSDGSLLQGMMYGGSGTESGNWVAAAANGGFNLFGASTASFGNATGSAWALRVDRNLQIAFQTGSLTGYEPALRDETPAITNTCVGATTYAAFTPVVQELNASAAALTIGGEYQANP